VWDQEKVLWVKGRGRAKILTDSLVIGGGTELKILEKRRRGITSSGEGEGRSDQGRLFTRYLGGGGKADAV